MLRTLQGLRIVFIMLVVACHYLQGQFEFGGECGVSFFFMLSGFVLSLAYSWRIAGHAFSTSRFVLTQWFKLYPLYVVTTLAMALLDARAGSGVDLWVLVCHLLMIQSWVPQETCFFALNGASWFLCDMMCCYLTFRTLNALLMGMRRRTLITVVGVLLCLYVVLACSVPQHMVNAILYVWPPLRLIDFGIGILSYRLYVALRQAPLGPSMLRPSRRYWCLGETFMLLFMAGAAVAYPALPQVVRTVSLFWAVMPGVVLFFALAEERGAWLTALLRSSWMVALGNATFEVYLLHLPLLRLFNSAVATRYLPSDSVSRAVLFVALLLSLSWLTHRYAVQPCYRNLLKLTK